MPFNAMQSIKNDKQPQDSKFNIVWPLMFCLLANQDSLNLYIQNTWVAILPRGVFSNLCLPTADMTDNYVTGEICHQSWCALRQKPEVHLHLITHPNRNIVSYETESQTNINRVPYVFSHSFSCLSEMTLQKKADFEKLNMQYYWIFLHAFDFNFHFNTGICQISTLVRVCLQ